VLKDYGLRITRLAMGLPVGSDLDFADQVTIKKALEGRTELKD
jgi:recombination protein RecR